MRINPLFLWSFIKRYWPLLILFVILVTLGRYEQVVFFFGPLFYLIELVVGVMVSMLLAIHVVFRQTIDPMLESIPDDPDGLSFFAKTWRSLERDEQLKWALIVFCTLTLSFSIIAAHIPQ